MSLGEAVGEAGGFGQAVATAEAEGPIGGGFEGDEVAAGDVEGSDAGAGAEDEADDLAVIDEGHAGASFRRDGAVHAAEPALGDADGGNAGEEAEVAGDAEAPRVGVTLAVDEEEVRLGGELLKGEAEGRRLAEGEEAGHVGKGDGALYHLLLDGFECGIGHHRGGGAREAGSRAAPAAARRVDVGDVSGGDEANVHRVAGAHDAPGEAALEGDCLCRG